MSKGEELSILEPTENFLEFRFWYYLYLQEKYLLPDTSYTVDYNTKSETLKSTNLL